MKKILLVEDNETIVMGLKYSLEQENFQVISAKSVAESKEKIKQEQIDIVLLDVSLPDGNGFDICKEIKEKQDTEEYQKGQEELKKVFYYFFRMFISIFRNVA